MHLLLARCLLESIVRFYISEFCAQRQQRQGPDSIIYTRKVRPPPKKKEQSSDFPALRLRRRFPPLHAVLCFCPGALKTIKAHELTDAAELRTANGTLRITLQKQKASTVAPYWTRNGLVDSARPPQHQ